MDDPNPTTVVVLAMLCAFSVIGALGNSLVLYIYGKRKKEKTTSTIFILSLATTDFLTCVLVIPFNAVLVSLSYKTSDDFSCKLWSFLITCNVPFSAFIMVAIAFDRFFCICHPFLYIINVPRSKIIVVCLAIFSCLLGLITSLGHGMLTGDESTGDINMVNCSFVSEVNGTVSDAILPICTTDEDKNMSCASNESQLQNSLNMTSLKQQLCANTSVYHETPGDCTLLSDILPVEFTLIYQKIYAGFYLVCFIAVVILYGLIYRAIHARRAQKSKRKRSSLYPSNTEPSMLETQMTVLNGNDTHVRERNTNGRKQRRQSALKDKLFYANIRTAAMLFVVTLVFLIAFLPAWLIAIRQIAYNAIIYNMYFVYNVANPLIYAFMNNSFRDDLIAVFMQCK